MPTPSFNTLLVTKVEHISYLTGVDVEGVVLLDMKRGRRILITDARYFERAKSEVSRGVIVVLHRDADTLPQLLKKICVTRLGIEADDLTLARFDAYKKQLKGVTLVPTTGIVAGKRLIKSPAEIATIARACDITSRILKAMLPTLTRGVTEIAVAETIRQLAAKFGATELAFDTIVAFGENAAIPHAVPGKRRLKKGDVVLFDMGVKVDGYCADMSRTFFTAEPTAFQHAAYDAVLAAQIAGVAAVRAGARCVDVDGVVRATLRDTKIPPSTDGVRPPLKKGVTRDDGRAAGDLSDYFTHSTGHGVGLEIHEAPSLSPRSDEVLAVGNIVTVEPGVYFSGEFGIRIEDTVVVEKTGVRILTPFPKKLTMLHI